MEFMYLGLGAALGCMLRMFLGQMFNKAKDAFPHGTFLANTIGSFVIGLAGGWGINHFVPSSVHLFMATGFCGALTTFSTFSLEVLRLITVEKIYLVALYVILSFALCFGLSLLGIYLGGLL